MVWAPSPRTLRPRTTEVILTIASITGGPYTEPVGELGEDDHRVADVRDSPRNRCRRQASGSIAWLSLTLGADIDMRLSS